MLVVTSLFVDSIARPYLNGERNGTCRKVLGRTFFTP